MFFVAGLLFLFPQGEESNATHLRLFFLSPTHNDRWLNLQGMRSKWTLLPLLETYSSIRPSSYIEAGLKKYKTVLELKGCKDAFHSKKAMRRCFHQE